MKKNNVGMLLILTVLCAIFLISGIAFAQEKSFKGVKLTVITQDGVIANPWRTAAQEWAKMTGAEVEVVPLSFTVLYDKLMTELISGTGTFDIIQCPSFWIGDIAGGGFVIPLDDYIKKDDPGWEDYIPAYRDRLSKWAGKIYALQCDGDVYVMAYREDLFKDPAEKAAFQAKYGYELKVPETWNEFYDVAEFFTRKAGDTLMGKPLDHDFYGALEVHKRGGGMGGIWWFLAHYASYINTPLGIYSGDIYFDPNTMEPRINSPAGFKAVEDLIKSIDPKRTIPGAMNMEWAMLPEPFIQGHVAITYAWPDIGSFALDKTRSQIVDKVAFAALPGSKEVWDVQKNEWVKLDKVHRGSPLAWGWEMLITNTCKNPDAAYDLMKYMVTGDRLVDRAIDPNDGIDPYKFSQFENPKVLEAYKDAPTYLPALKENLLVGVPDLVIPRAIGYYDALELWIDKAKLGEMSIEEAMKKAAEDWNKLTDEMGRELQKKLYRESLGLPIK